jgi:ATP-dependent DNA helicase RecG
MILDELREILARGEDIVTEYKECTDKLSKTVYETVSSFSNRYGGYMVIGADDDGNVLGVDPEAVKRLKKDFIDGINNSNKFSPTLYITLEDVEIDGKIVLLVHIPVASQVVRCNGRIWDRGEDGDHDITDAIIAVGELYARKSGQFTERRVFPYASEDDLRLDELMPRVRIMADTKMPGHPWKDMDNMEIMRSAGLYEDNPYSKEKGFNLAGILLFGTDETILACCPGYVTDCILRRIDLDRYDDRLMIRTNLIDAYNQAIQFIREYTPDPFFLEGVQRVSVRDKIARELVSNSLVHREFSTTRIARIIIEKDRIYADNWSRSSQSGKLDPTTFVPEPKNPLLAHFFENIGYAD